ncbi:MAG: hypothetical protein Q8882_00400 [Bacillota bacterium]|nr:hypothetical protein [Bacillota bacterium]
MHEEKDSEISLYSLIKANLSLLATLLFVIANIILFCVQLGYLIYFQIPYDFVNIEISYLIVVFVIVLIISLLIKITYDVCVKNYKRRKKKYLYALMPIAYFIIILVTGSSQTNIFNIDKTDYFSVFFILPLIVCIGIAVSVFSYRYLRVRKLMGKAFPLVYILIALSIMLIMGFCGFGVAKCKVRYPIINNTYLYIANFKDQYIVTEFKYDENEKNVAIIKKGEFKFIPMDQTDFKMHNFKKVYRK